MFSSAPFVSRDSFPSTSAAFSLTVMAQTTLPQLAERISMELNESVIGVGAQNAAAVTAAAALAALHAEIAPAAAASGQ